MLRWLIFDGLGCPPRRTGATPHVLRWILTVRRAPPAIVLCPSGFRAVRRTQGSMELPVGADASALGAGRGRVRARMHLQLRIAPDRHGCTGSPPCEGTAAGPAAVEGLSNRRVAEGCPGQCGLVNWPSGGWHHCGRATQRRTEVVGSGPPRPVTGPSVAPVSCSTACGPSPNEIELGVTGQHVEVVVADAAPVRRHRIATAVIRGSPSVAAPSRLQSPHRLAFTAAAAVQQPRCLVVSLSDKGASVNQAPARRRAARPPVRGPPAPLTRTTQRERPCRRP